ncbi:hypothetical protein GCM10022226_53090 [Sphaerisporangium flaviroseum]|uniref:SHOCT domain-containing protein n=1 Tax=Sphaerisporangium flaviroseum TaxID=509199 RepID=A0ABP7IS93_9ACTN
MACCLTMLFLGSRLVMSIGGSCGSGGPYVAATPCPDGLGWIMPVSIIGGMIAVGVYAVSLLPVGPRLILLAWPALFLSLGWDFLEAALDGSGVEWAFMVCAVIFALMGGAPLLFLFNRATLRAVFWGPAPKVVPPPVTPRGSVRWTTSIVLPGDDDPPQDATGGQARQAVPLPRFVDLGPGGVPADAGTGDLVGQLERLSALHRTGRLDDAEYAAAKARLLNGSR